MQVDTTPAVFRLRRSALVRKNDRSHRMDTPGIQAVATAVRTFSMDAVQMAGSGHPGQPMGCAELGERSIAKR